MNYDNPYEASSSGGRLLGRVYSATLPILRPDDVAGFRFGAGGSSRDVLAAMQITSQASQRSAIDSLKMRSRVTNSRDYLSWMPQGGSLAEAASAGDQVLYAPVVSAATKPANQFDDASRQTLEQIVSNHLAARRVSYLQRGWSSFEEGDYQGALRAFALAENASLNDSEERAYVKLIMVYAGIAAGQYSSASDCLNWLLSADAQTGRLQYADVLNRIFDENRISTIGELYATPQELQARGAGWLDADYLKQNQTVESMAAASPDSPAIRALLAMVEWGRGRRTNAMFEAEKIKNTGTRLDGLAQLMKDAELMRNSRPVEAMAKSRATRLVPDTQPMP